MCPDLKFGLIIASLRSFIVCCDLQNAPKVLIFVHLMLRLDSRVVYAYSTAKHCSYCAHNWKWKGSLLLHSINYPNFKTNSELPRFDFKITIMTMSPLESVMRIISGHRYKIKGNTSNWVLKCEIRSLIGPLSRNY